jgi:IS5 family transposase
MKPKPSHDKIKQRDLFRPELSNIIDPRHRLVKLAKAVNWDRMEAVFGKCYCPDKGRPAIDIRLMITLQYLKVTCNLSDSDVVSRWVENPYWQYLSGMQYFEHVPPINPSSMTRWRKRIIGAGAEELLKKTIADGLKIRAASLHRACVATTAQEETMPVKGGATP